MYMCKVQGKCVSTIKHPELKGCSLITVQAMNKSGNAAGELFVVVDPIGCSVGEVVLVTRGSSARAVLGDKHPSDMVVVGIIDAYES